MRKIRGIKIVGDLAFVQLTRGRFSVIDACDVGIVSELNWSLHTDGRGKEYARSSDRQHLLLHRLIISPGCDQEVDHIDGDGLNNRRKNLRIASRQQNKWNTPKQKNNTSGFLGVGRERRRWRAQIAHNGRKIRLGSFDTAESAAMAYDFAAKRLFGEFACLNFKEREGAMNVAPLIFSDPPRGWPPGGMD